MGQRVCLFDHCCCRIATCDRIVEVMLADSWEPFAVTGSTYDNYYVWLRRSAARADAEIVRNPPRPRHEPETVR
jgi:hypothetical protein